MSFGKRCAIIFLVALNLINFVAGAVVDYKLLSGERVRQILPHHLEISSVQIMLLDFFVLTLIIALISVVTMLLACDVTYSPLEVLQNFAFVFFIIPLVLSAVMVYGAYTTKLDADRIWIVISAVSYLVMNAVNICCVLTVKSDED